MSVVTLYLLILHFLPKPKVFPGETLFTAEGCVKGTIALHCEGDSGFGYDPIFIPEGYQHSFSVLGSEVKHNMSHRFKALQQVKEYISRFLEQTPNRGSNFHSLDVFS